MVGKIGDFTENLWTILQSKLINNVYYLNTRKKVNHLNKRFCVLECWFGIEKVNYIIVNNRTLYRLLFCTLNFNQEISITSKSLRDFLEF